MYSSPVTFTPAGAGNYSVSWSYFGKGGCGDASKAGYTPFFGVMSGDIAAGAGFGSGSCAEGNADIQSWNKNIAALPNYFGAGSSIGAWATGDITNFVSGMGLNGGVMAQSGHGLSFANASNGEGNTPPNYGGGFGSNSIACVNDYYGNASGAALGSGTTGTFAASDIPAAAGVYSFNANAGKTAGFTLTLGSAAAGADMTIPQGYTFNLYVYGNVYIKNNVKYGAYALTTVPRFNLYVDGNIYIDPAVTELHGVYMAQKSTSLPGNITTCADSVSATTEPYSACTNKLLVVGAMAAQGQLRLTRTHGNLVAVPAASVAAEPAETFQYSPEMWLNAPPLTGLRVKAYTSLPPVL
jgi:hypothetical protein